MKIVPQAANSSNDWVYSEASRPTRNGTTSEDTDALARAHARSLGPVLTAAQALSLPVPVARVRQSSCGKVHSHHVHLSEVTLNDWKSAMTDHARENGIGTMDGRLGALRSELETLETDMKVLVDDVEGIADSRVHLAIRKAEDVAHGAYRLAEESVAHVANDVKNWTNGNLATVRRSVRARPISLLALSAGAGALVGTILGIARRRSPHNPL